MKKICYWAPCLDKVGTYKAVINSALSLSKYSKDSFQVYIINACGEWDEKKFFFTKNNIKVINLNFSYFNYLPKVGYLNSRLSNLFIFIFSIIPLFKFLSKTKPDFLIGHLVTALPIFLFNFFDFKTKFILRISGFPKLNFLRKNFWKRFSKKIFKVTCPSEDLKKQMADINIFTENKLLFLPDPIINMSRFRYQIEQEKKKEIKTQNQYFIAAGRLTKQKNFTYLINEFNSFLKDHPNNNLLIFGEGEQKKKLEIRIDYLKLNKKVFLMGFNNNLYPYMKKAKAFILSSLWEDPGFVIIEAALSNLFVISSDCKNGPNEFLLNGKAGILYSSDKKNKLCDSLNIFEKMSQTQISSMKLVAKRNCFKYTLFRHHSYLKKILNSN